MKKVIVTKEVVEGYLNYLKAQEKSRGTLEKYRRELYELMFFLSDTEVRKEELLLWKGALEKKYCPSGVNGRLVAANGFFTFLGKFDLRMKLLRIQREIFSNEEKELTRAEYGKLVRTAENRGNQRLALVIQTICSTGIRVSELSFITAEAVRKGRAEVNCKGKRRVVFLPQELRKKLIQYGKKKRIEKGPLFTTKSGKPLDRSNIWADMKKLCRYAEVSAGKVFPHNLRHLFARTFYALEKDMAKLADLLGHSSIETTRIYIMESGREHQKRLEKMGLVL